MTGDEAPGGTSVCIGILGRKTEVTGGAWTAYDFPKEANSPGEADLCWGIWQRDYTVLSVDPVTVYLSLFISVVSRVEATCDIVKKE